MGRGIFIMTNAIGFVKCYTNDANYNTKVLYNVINANKFRGIDLALAINDKTTTGKDISNFKLDSRTSSNIAKAPSKNKEASSILGFYNEDLFTCKKESNVTQIGNIYYLATEGIISNKDILSDRYDFDKKLSTTDFLLSYLKMNFQLFSNPKDAIMETIKYLKGDYSFILYINPISSVYWYTNTELFYRKDENKFVISSEQMDWAEDIRTDHNVLYVNLLEYNMIQKFKPHKDRSELVYTCIFDNTIESVVAMYAVKEIFNPKKINVITNYKNYLDVQYALQNDEVFNVIRTRIDHLAELPKDEYDVFIDSINVDSQYRLISDIYDLQYRANTEEPYMKYYPIFRELRITDIVKLGIYLNVPFGRFKLCEREDSEYYTTDTDRLFCNCGKCNTCIRTKSIFDKIGYNLKDTVFEDPIIKYKDHKLIDNLKIKNCENFNSECMDDADYIKIVNYITKDGFKYVG